MATRIDEASDKLVVSAATDREQAVVAPNASSLVWQRVRLRTRRVLRLAVMSGGRRWGPISFVGLVAMPSVLSVLYFALVAAPQYMVETRMVVRSAETSEPTSSTSPMVNYLTFSSTAQNAYIVAHYIRSRAIVEDLITIAGLNLRAIYRRPEADFWARLKDNATTEELVDYWLDMVRAYVDATSGIVAVEIKAFRPQDALALAQALTSLSERLVNNMSQHAREDVMGAAVDEVRLADSRMRSALQALQAARNAEGMLDPIKSANETGKLLVQLLNERVRLESELYVASRSLDKTAPSVRQMGARLQVLDDQINKLKAGMAGKSSVAHNVASSLNKFELLETQRLLAEKLLDSAEEGLERARIRAERQNLYLMVFVPGSLPVKAQFPRRVAYSFLLPTVFLIGWSIIALMFASIEDHRV